MKIKFLGTSAAEGMPAVFCNCDTCRKAKAKGGKNIRTRSQILINNDLLFDFPMDSYFHMITNKLDLTEVENIFITHAHMDHCYPLEFTLHGSPFAHNMTNEILNIYGNKTVIKRAGKMTAKIIREEVKSTLKMTVIKPYTEIKLKNYTVIALPAAHTKGEDCLIYLLTDGFKTFLQFNDSGILPESVYSWLEENNKKIDVVSFDCTYGYTLKGAGRHMGVLDNINERERMIRHNLVNEETKYILTHFSHNGGLLYDEMVDKVRGLGFEVAFDGMEVSL